MLVYWSSRLDLVFFLHCGARPLTLAFVTRCYRWHRVSLTYVFFRPNRDLRLFFPSSPSFYASACIHIAWFSFRNFRPFFVRLPRPSHTDRSRPLNRFVRLQASFYTIYFMIILIVLSRRFFSIYKFFVPSIIDRFASKFVSFFAQF